MKTLDQFVSEIRAKWFQHARHHMEQVFAEAIEDGVDVAEIEDAREHNTDRLFEVWREYEPSLRRQLTAWQREGFPELDPCAPPSSDALQ